MLITSVIPTIIKTETEAKIARNILKVSPICSKSLSIFSSATGSHSPGENFITYCY